MPKYGFSGYVLIHKTDTACQFIFIDAKNSRMYIRYWHISKGERFEMGSMFQPETLYPNTHSVICEHENEVMYSVCIWLQESYLFYIDFKDSRKDFF